MWKLKYLFVSEGFVPSAKEIAYVKSLQIFMKFKFWLFFQLSFKIIINNKTVEYGVLS